MLQIAICDDEHKMRTTLREIIDRELSLMGLPFQIKEFDCGESLTGIVNNAGLDILFDLIFLDIEMKDLNGIETARQLRRTNKKAVIIFVTAFPDFVFQGYEVKAFHYILKPFQDQKIAKVLHLALEELDALQPHYYAIEQKSGITKLPLQDTLYFTSEKRNITAVTKTGTVTFYDKLDDLQEKLPDYFIRIHNRFLANLNHITGVDASSASCGGNPLPVSRRYRQDLMVAFAKYMLR